MQRVRIGLTGLAFVFVAVMLAAALTREPVSEAPVTANSLAGPVSANTSATAPRQEPLADLGVAPRSSDANSSADAAPGGL